MKKRVPMIILIVVLAAVFYTAITYQYKPELCPLHW